MNLKISNPENEINIYEHLMQDKVDSGDPQKSHYQSHSYWVALENQMSE